MRRELIISTEPIDESRLLAGRQMSPAMGAVVSFTGVVRGSEAGVSIQALDYEAFVQMAEHQFQTLFNEVECRWPIESLRLVHRIGVIPVGEPSLWVEVVCPHRAEAFAACQWVIEELKLKVPIWKRAVAPAEEKGK